MNTNYSQIVNQTVEEKFRMYMKHSKKELARMLANRDLLDLSRPVTPYVASWPTHCRSWEDCTNPQFDCINCPLRNRGGSAPVNNLRYTTTCTL